MTYLQTSDLAWGRTPIGGQPKGSSLVSEMPQEPTPPILPEGTNPSRFSGHQAVWIALTLGIIVAVGTGAVALFILFWAALE